MPELPNLAVFAANLASKLNGKEVVSIEFHDNGRLKVSLPELQTALVGASLANVKRCGKEILFQFSNNSVLLLHLTSGGFVITQTPRVVEFKSLTVSFKD